MFHVIILQVEKGNICVMYIGSMVYSVMKELGFLSFTTLLTSMLLNIYTFHSEMLQFFFKVILMRFCNLYYISYGITAERVLKL